MLPVCRNIIRSKSRISFAHGGRKKSEFRRRRDMAKKGKIRIIFGRDMSPEEMLDAVIRMAKEYGIPFVDNRKEHGIPIVDSRKKESKKGRGKGKPRISPP